MSIETEYLELFSERVAIFPAASMDVYGKFTYSASVSASAHLVSESKLVVKPDGREVMQTGKAILYGQVAVNTQSKIVLADGTSPVIVSVDTPHDENGWHHTVVGLSA